MSVCCFAGHDKVYGNDDERKLTEVCQYLINQSNVTEFWVGNYGGFDRLAANVIRKLKKSYNLKLYLIIPYLTESINKSRAVYADNYDGIIIANIPPGIPQRYKILHTNRFMIDNSTFLICFINHSWGGAAKTYEYALINKNIRIYNIG